jgi:hypothetical protein
VRDDAEPTLLNELLERNKAGSLRPYSPIWVRVETLLGESDESALPSEPIPEAEYIEGLETVLPQREEG